MDKSIKEDLKKEVRGGDHPSRVTKSAPDVLESLNVEEKKLADKANVEHTKRPAEPSAIEERVKKHDDEELISPWDPVNVFIANFLGMVTSLLFTGMYVPQFLLNLRRKSTEGFSSTGIIIKLVGASFLAVNAWVTGEALPVVAYGALNILQHSAFMFQFFKYARTGGGNNIQFLLWMFTPVLPYLMYLYVPWTMVVTSYFKPVSQVLSHVPQLMECKRLRTTSGVSLMSQHLNFVGGVMGLYMCWVITPKSPMTWFLYINSIMQAVTLYAAWLIYDSPYFSQYQDPSVRLLQAKYKN